MNPGATGPDWADLNNLTPDVLIGVARERAGLEDFGSDSFREGLTLVAEGMRRDVMSRGGRRLLGDLVVRYLENRLQVTEHHRLDPEIAQRNVTAPNVILGLPRTGTTVLSYLLDQDPQWRSLLNWEAVQSAPPAPPGEHRTDQRCLDLLEFQHSVLPLIDPPPPHWEWADGPTECTFLLAQDFKAAMWESRVPYQPYRDFISAVDMTSAYDYHRSVLQLLQHDDPTTWVLKMPAHAYFIDGLLERYPDARIIWTHRDPVTATASFMNLTAFSHRLSMGEADAEWIARTVPDRMVEQARRPMEALAGRNVFHVDYARASQDQFDVMEELYAWLDVPLSAEVRTAMHAWLDRDPLAVSRGARYALEDFGVDRAELRGRFTDYIDTFNVTLD